MILTQKLKLKEDDQDGEDQKLLAQIRKLEFALQKAQSDLEEKEQANQDLQDKVSNLEKTNSGSNFNEKKLKDLIRALEFQVDELMEQLETADNSRKKIKNEFQDANEKIISLEEQLYESKTIQNELLEQLKDIEDKFEDKVNELEEKLEMTEKQLEQSEKQLEQSEKQLEQSEKRLSVVEELEYECQGLRKENHKLKYSVYIPRKGDNVDAKLSDYINGRPENDHMKIMFLRESEGVYQFGQKRVYVKVEKGGQVLVRVGGGYMHIEEFIDTYSNNEVEKIHRKDPMSRFQQKLAVQKISQH